jgi:hypothetical protein
MAKGPSINEIVDAAFAEADVANTTGAAAGTGNVAHKGKSGRAARMHPQKTRPRRPGGGR